MELDDITVLDSINDVDSKQWDGIVESSPYDSFFQKTPWLKSIEEGMGLEPRHLLIYSDSSIVGLFPNFINDIESSSFPRMESLPIGYGGPIIPYGDVVLFSLMMDKIEDICKRSRAIHRLQTFDSRYVGYWCMLRERHYNPIFRCSFQNDLSKGIEHNFFHLNKKNKRILANYYGNFRYEIGNINEENLNIFYSSYAKAMSEKRSRAISREFFDALMRNCPENVVIVSQFDGDTHMGSKLRVIDNTRNTIHCVLSGIENKYLLEYVPFLINWHTINWGIENKFDLLDWGVMTDDVRDNTFELKNSIGGLAMPNILWERPYGSLRRLYRVFNRN